jgi:GntR family transcriptional regulator, transcriptional repressor for pyruvate dehydrogenase complex
MKLSAEAAFTKVERVHAADTVFDQIARSILRGDRKPESALPPERVLSEQFGVSRIIARQALHKLADMGLVEVRQGGKTVVRPFAEVTDLRALLLLYQYCPDDPHLAEEIFEKQYLQGLALVEIATRHLRAEDRALLSSITESKDNLAGLEERFWRALAQIGQNRVLLTEIAWWYAHMPQKKRSRSEEVPVRAFYKELTRRICKGLNPIAFYREALAPSLRKKVGGYT